MNKVLSMIVPLNQGFKYCPISISFFFLVDMKVINFQIISILVDHFH